MSGALNKTEGIVSTFLSKNLVCCPKYIPAGHEWPGYHRTSPNVLVALEIIAVNINRGNGRVILLLFLCGIEEEDREVLHDDEFDLGDVVGVDPVLEYLVV